MPGAAKTRPENPNTTGNVRDDTQQLKDLVPQQTGTVLIVEYYIRDKPK